MCLIFDIRWDLDGFSDGGSCSAHAADDRFLRLSSAIGLTDTRGLSRSERLRMQLPFWARRQ